MTLFYSCLFTLFFSPVVLAGRVLAPGDALLYYLPNFLAPRVLWDRLILSGFPTFADPQVLLWYPVSMLLSLFELWNGFVISAYVMASGFTYGYVYALTRSRLAGAAGGIVYGMSGFMMAHLGHTTIIHGAVWLPLLVWALEELRAKLGIGWLVIGSIAVACSLLAHPQIFLQGQMVCVPYVLLLGWNAPVGRWRYYLASAVVVGTGVGAAAIQWVPTAELSAWSVREQMTFEEFTSYALPVRQLPSLLFPYLFGGWGGYAVRYFGRWNLVELTGYAGIVPLALAAIGAITWRRRSLALFWLGVGLFALLLTLGAATPLALIAYHVPLINKFRAPGRHFLEVALAVSVLTGLGVSATLRGWVGSRLVLLVSAVLIGTTGACLVSVMLVFSFVRSLAPQDIADLRLAPWAYLPAAIPLGILLVGLGVLVYWSRRPRQGWRVAALLAMLVVDLASFGWFVYWRNASPATHVLEPTEIAERYRPILDAARQRLMPLRGGLGSPGELMPNLSRLWDVPSASGYGPLLLRRVGLMVAMNPGGLVEDRALNAEDQGLDLLAVRFITLPTPPPLGRHPDVKWSAKEFDLSTGVGCGASARPLEFDLPVPVVATKIGVVSWLGCSTAIPDGTAVAEVVVRDASGAERAHDLRAGRDAAEFAYDCSDVRPHVKHRRAPIFSSFPIARPRESCEGHRYVSFLSLKGATTIQSVSVRWIGGEGVLALRNLTLIDEAEKVSYPLVKSAVPRADRWRHVDDHRGTSVYENRNVRPRAWLVPEAIAAGPEEILNAIKTSKLSDGRPFNPARTALVEESRLAFAAENFDAAGTAEVTRLTSGQVDVRTSATSASFLVMSDIYYPGWDVSIDGQPAKLVLTDYVLRGVVLPAGPHRVRLTFRPTSLWVGAAISGASLIVLAGICIVWRGRRD